MMKLFVLLALVPALAAASSSTNLCPSGYYYAGEDIYEYANTTAPDPRNEGNDVDSLSRSGTYYIEEVDRSDMYSCYKLVSEPADWVSAMAACTSEEAQLASFETDIEMERVRDLFQQDFQPKAVPVSEGNKALPRGVDFLTSGMFFDEVQNWYWTASNRSLSKDKVYSNDEVPDNKPTLLRNAEERDLEIRIIKTCLNFRMTSPGEDPILLDASCFEKQPFICEARVQTVTYYTWFRANWVDFMLGFLLVILFVALCVAVCSFTSKDYGNRSRYNNTRARTTTITAAHIDPMAQHHNYAMDMPPAYDQTVTVHKPNPDPAPAAPSTYDSFKVKSKEMGSKVFYYRPGSAKTSTTA